MNYATSEDYDLYGKGAIPGPELDQALELASSDIDTLTYSRIVGRGFESLTDFQRERVVRAVCLHADFVYQYGDYVHMPLSGYSAGSTSMSFKAEQGAGGIKTSAPVLQLLKATGLTDRRLC